MTWMNRYDITEAVEVLDADTFPNAVCAARVLERLMRWTDSHSDGWSSWPKPSRAATPLMSSLKAAMDSRYHGRNDEYDVDMTDAELKAALTPIKSFLTRQISEGHATVLERTEILEGPQAESQHVLSVVLVQSEIDALLTLSSNAGLSPSAWIARQITTAVA